MLYSYDSAASREDGESEDLHLSRDADQVVTEHGDEAGHVAAHRADSLFRNGDIVGGSRWLKIFRRIALAHRRLTID
jgi:hypothetical protein